MTSSSRVASAPTGGGARLLVGILVALATLPGCAGDDARTGAPQTPAPRTDLRPLTDRVTGGDALAAALLAWTSSGRPSSAALPDLPQPLRAALEDRLRFHALDHVEIGASAAGDGLDPAGSARIRRLAAEPDAPADSGADGSNLDDTLADELERLAALAGAEALLAGRAWSMAPVDATSLELDTAADTLPDRSDPTSLRSATPDTLRLDLRALGSAFAARTRTALSLAARRRGTVVGASPREGLLALVALQQALALDETVLDQLLVDHEGTSRRLDDPDAYDPAIDPVHPATTVRFTSTPATPRRGDGVVTEDLSADLTAQATLLRAAAELGWLADPGNPIAGYRELFDGPPFGERDAGNPATPGLLTWEDDVRPLLHGPRGGCLSCHAPPAPESRFRIDSYDHVLGRDPNALPRSGVAPVSPGDRQASPLWLVLGGPWTDPGGRRVPRMPRGRAPLAPAEIELVGAWIDQGAVERRRPDGPGARPGMSLARVLLQNLLVLHTVDGGRFDGLQHARHDGDGSGLVEAEATGATLSAAATFLLVAPDEPGLAAALDRWVDAALRHLVDGSDRIHATLDLHRADPDPLPAEPRLGASAALVAGVLAAARALDRPDLAARGRALGTRLLDDHFEAATGRPTERPGVYTSTWSATDLAHWCDALRELAVAGSPTAVDTFAATVDALLPVFTGSELDGSGELLGDGEPDTDQDGIPETRGGGPGPRFRAAARIGADPEPDPDRRISFVDQILPLFRARCAGCHVEGARQGDYALDTPRLAARGGESGRDDLLVPGDAEASLLFRKLADRSPPVGAQMPLDLPPVERRGLALLRAWIHEGARNR